MYIVLSFCVTLFESEQQEKLNENNFPYLVIETKKKIKIIIVKHNTKHYISSFLLLFYLLHVQDVCVYSVEISTFKMLRHQRMEAKVERKTWVNKSNKVWRENEIKYERKWSEAMQVGLICIFYEWYLTPTHYHYMNELNTYAKCFSLCILHMHLQL